MEAYFKLKKDSKVGIKIGEFIRKSNKARDVTIDFLEEIGATPIAYHNQMCFSGGAFIFTFDKEPDLKLWKRYKGTTDGYTPKRNSKKGKEISKKIDSLPKTMYSELLEILGADYGIFVIPGSILDSKDNFYYFNVKPDWFKNKLPEEAIEITHSEYMKASN